MMKKTFWVMLFSLCVVFASLAWTVHADDVPELTVAAEGADYTSVEQALAAAETMAKNGELNANGVRIVLTGTHTATSSNSILFGQKTIFLPNGKKMPITITGGTLNLPAASVVCTNDYTFTGINIPFDDVQTKLYAGTGNVVLGHITMDLNGTAGEFKSRFYGDNFTAKAFQGWTEEQLALYSENGLFVSSMTLANGFSYQNPSAYAYAAVGSSTDFSATVGTKTVSADDTCPKLIVDGATLQNTMARAGNNPVANSVLEIKSGSVKHVYAGGFNLQTTLTGDVTVLVDGTNAKLNDFPRLLSKVTLNGDLNATFKNVDLMDNTVENGKMIQLAFSGVSVNGDINVSMENVKADRYYGALSTAGKTVKGNVSVTAKNCDFSRFYYGGFGQASIEGNVENNLENVTTAFYRGLDECPALTGNLTTSWKNVSLAEQTAAQHMYMGSIVSCTVQGNFINTLEEVTTGNNANLYMGAYNGTLNGNIINTLEEVTTANNSNLYMGAYNGTLNGNITSTIKSGTFGEYVYGANNSGVITGTVTNNIQGGTFDEEVYLGGYYVEHRGQIVNNVSGGHFHKIYLYCGTRGGKITNTTIDYAVKNTFTGGYFKGVWGGSGGGSATHQGNIYNEISGGTFDVYNTTTKTNSFAGGCRNGKHTGNVKTLIRGGTFTGFVAGGSIPNDEKQQKQHEGNTELILAGGTFRDTITPNCRMGSYTGQTVLNVNTEQALEPLLLTANLECRDLIASSDRFELTVSVPTVAESVIARGSKALIVNSKIQAESLTAEQGSAEPVIYGTANLGTLTLNGAYLNLGARTRITVGSVTGNARLHQTELWCANTYFTSPADTVIEISEEENAFGRVQVKNGTVKGLSSAMAGVAFVFTDNVSLRFAFDKEWAEAGKDNFNFTAKAGNQTIVQSASFDDLVLKDGYYSVLSDPIYTVNYNQPVTYTGTYLPENSFKMVDLAATGIMVYDKAGQYRELGTLLKAFSNYAIATDNYKNGKNNPLPYENLATPTDFAQLQAGDETWGGMNVTENRGTGYMTLTSTAHLELIGRKIILDDGIRVRYVLKTPKLKKMNQSSAKLHSLHFWNGCEDITSTITKTWVNDGYEDLIFPAGYYQVTVDIPLYPSDIGNYVRFLVTEQATLNNDTTYVIDHVDRMDALAEELGTLEGWEEISATLLYYVQASKDYYITQPNLDDYVYPTEFSAGWATGDFSPYGFRMHMYSYARGQIVLDPMHVTCLALWDGEDLALYYSFDLRQCDDTFTKTYKEFLSQRFGVDPDKIFFNATHDHSSPDAGSRTKENVQRWYKELLEPNLITVTKQAIYDLAPCEVYAGKATSAPGTNYVRRYFREDGSYTGIHVYETTEQKASPVVRYESEADKELRTLRFDRGDGRKDIVLVNWQGHAAHGANLYDYQFTADFVGFLRDGVQEELGVNFIYCNGASGNLNFTPKTAEDISAKYFTNQYFEGVGKSLVGTVKTALSGEEKVQTGKIQVKHIEYMAPVKVDPDDIREKAIAVNDACKAYAAEHGAWTSVTQQRNYIFNNFANEAPYLQSTYHMSAILTRNNYKVAGTTELLIDVFALSFGDVAMGFVPYEQFDTNAKQTRDGVSDLYKITITGGYTNGTKSYVPSNLSSINNTVAMEQHYGGYEVYTCRFADGTGDGVAAAITAALRAMKEQ